MKFDKAVTRAKVLNALTHNPDIRFEAVENRQWNDTYVIQLYKDKFAGIAAY